jgi:hypothetical protein
MREVLSMSFSGAWLQAPREAFAQLFVNDVYPA